MATTDLTATADHLASLLEDAERAAGTYSDDPSNWCRRHSAEMHQLGERLAEAGIGALLTQHSDAVRFRCHGFTASSTSGTAGAIRNWIARARAKAA